MKKLIVIIVAMNTLMIFIFSGTSQSMENSSILTFGEDYEEAPTECSTYEDVVYILCYMIHHNMEAYEITIEEISYIDGEIVGIVEEDVIKAYKDVAQLFNLYTDFWSGLKANSTEEFHSDGTVFCITYSFNLFHKNGMDTEEIIEKIETVEVFSETLIHRMYEEGNLNDQMSDKEKSYIIYQWMVNHVDYAYTELDGVEQEVTQDNAYECLINGEAVCQGIASAYIHLCRLAGVPMLVQLGYTNGSPHSWCKIEVNGSWMYIDPTWGLTGTAEAEQGPDQWFWVSKEFMEEHTYGGRVFVDYM